MKVQPTYTSNPVGDFKFHTFGEAGLVKMLAEANRFAGEFTDETYGGEPRWLSFLGSSGVGKTYLATKLCEIAREYEHLTTHATLVSPVQFWVWMDLLDRLRDKEHWLMRDAIDCNFLVVDDFGAERGTDYSVEQFYRLCNGRLRKWTMFTSNMSRGQIAELDVRIASRLGRQGNEIVACDGILDFCLRKDL